LVDQAEAGYHLTEVGFQVLAEQGAAIAARCGDAPLAQALLPPEVTAEQVADHLEGRWFQGLHWYGRAGGFDELTLVWTLTADEGARVRLRIQGNLFSVTVDCCREPSRATYQAVHALVTAVTELYGMEPERAEHADGPRAMTHGPRQAS
ncbi:MAG: hypothetical protein R3185_09655, partial [Candidatus Thermoplasmatota archaeon]|nr:hypothetical protein [Candidatus Thermoplasmatota archaeon]